MLLLGLVPLANAGQKSFGVNVFDSEPVSAIDISRDRDYMAVAGRKSKKIHICQYTILVP